jgi:hypothetical protein
MFEKNKLRKIFVKRMLKKTFENKTQGNLCEKIFEKGMLREMLEKRKPRKV